jgi:uncharacterized protein (TIGR01244 family)
MQYLNGSKNSVDDHFFVRVLRQDRRALIESGFSAAKRQIIYQNQIQGDNEMEKITKINDQVTVGAQPSEEQLQRLSKQGFKSVVNFRTEGENEQLLSHEAEGEQVRAAGMTYLHIPVSMKSMGPKVVDQFREKYVALPKPVFAHCKSGKRAGAMVMMQMAIEQAMTGDQALQKAKEMGFECGQPELEQFIRQYVNEHLAEAK